MAARQKTWRFVGLAAALVLVWVALPYGRAAAFLLDLTDSSATVRRIFHTSRPDMTVATMTVPTRAGPVAVRLYRPRTGAAGTIVVFPGVHGGGVEEERLSAFSGRLAEAGFIVLSAPVPELRAYVITASATDTIEDVTLWASRNVELAPGGRVGLVGVSFAGGLAIVAAGRASLAGRLTLVLSIGGHGDLARVLHYLCTGRLPDGHYRTPHAYGLAVLALTAAPNLVPPDQAASLSSAIKRYLDESQDEGKGEDALHLREVGLDLASKLPTASQTVMHWIAVLDVDALGRALDPYMDDLAASPALSPERSRTPTAPVFLLHGADDNVIPSTETPLLARYLRASGLSAVYSLLTPALSHADLRTDLSLVDGWRLLDFWRRALLAGG